MKKHLITAAVSAAFLGAPLAATASEAELLARIEKMAAELEQLKVELKTSVSKTEAVELRQQEIVAAPASAGCHLCAGRYPPRRDRDPASLR